MSLPNHNQDETHYKLGLDNCAREPIHIPGAIQPHGMLLAFEPLTGVVLHSSANLHEILPSRGALDRGRSLVELLGEENAELVMEAMKGRGAEEVRHVTLSIDLGFENPDRVEFLCLAHVYRGVGILEIEPCAYQEPDRNWLQELEDAIGSIRTCEDLQGMVDMVAKRVKRFTGFDRVMVYQFAQDWSGHVVSDEREPEMESFLGLHYPASDIPAQARELYRTNLVRYIADVHYKPVTVLPRNPKLGQLLDMSHATLRSVSPVHLQYLKNMDVGSTLVISIMRHDKLWGLISCQHRQPTQLPLQTRRACHSLSITVSYMLHSLLFADELKEQAQSSKLCRDIAQAFSQTHVSLQGVIEQCEGKLLQVASSPCALMWKDGHVYPIGKWPGQPPLNELVDYAKHRLQAEKVTYFAEDRLPATLRRGNGRESQICGMAALNLDSFSSIGLLWVRPEYIREVTWGGNPDKHASVQKDEQGNVSLSPRSSFAAWAELVKDTSRPWLDRERHAIEQLSSLAQTLTVRDSLIQVRISDRNFRSLISLQSEAYWQIDETGYIEVFSRPLIFDFNQSEPSLPALFLPFCGPEQTEELAKRLTAKKSFRKHTLVLTEPKTQKSLAYEINGEVLRDKDGFYAGMHGTIVDVSEEHQTRSKLLEAKLAAEQAASAKSSFLSTIGHEIRTPLNALMGLTHLLTDETQSERGRDLIAKMKVAGGNLAVLINDLLDVAKIEAGELRLEPEPTKLSAVIDTLKVLCETLPAGKSIDLAFLSLPKTLENKTFLIDRQRVVQVLLNLLSNAIKFTQEGTVSLKCLDSGPQTEAHGMPTTLVSFEVSDTGVGMSQEALNTVFEPFVQIAGEHQHGTKGTGLGLTIVRQLVEMMNGRLNVSSQPGEGTKILVEIPMLEGLRDEQPVSEKQAPTATDLSPYTILLVDDNELNLLVAENILKAQGANVHTCLDGNAAIEMMKRKELGINMVLMDLQMPVMDGFEAARIIRQQHDYDHIPIVALSASSTSSVVKQCEASGMNGHINKPIEPERFLRLVEQFAA